MKTKLNFLKVWSLQDISPDELGILVESHYIYMYSSTIACNYSCVQSFGAQIHLFSTRVRLLKPSSLKPAAIPIGEIQPIVLPVIVAAV